MISLVNQANLSFDFDLSDLSENDIVNDLENKDNDEDDLELDLEPVRKFMEDYVGQVIVNISGKEDLSNVVDKTRATVITGVILDGENLKFKLDKLNGEASGYLIISPTKHGMFREKLSEEGMDVHSVYQITFYDGYSLEYLDSEGQGQVKHQEL